MMKNKLIGIFVCMLFVSTIFPVSGNQILDSNSIQLPLGNTLYVGGDGPENYTKIQDAINDASDGDTVFVYDDNSPYYENVRVNKSITLMGENKETTVIDGRNIGFVVNVPVQYVTITGFKIINSGTGSGFAGVYVHHANHCLISGNIIENNHYGIFEEDSTYCNITKNIVNNNYYRGIVITSPFAHISKNVVTNTSWIGIDIHRITDSLICEMNHIESNGYTGIYLYKSNSNTIRNNNFIRNKHHALFVEGRNTWTNNYWGKSRFLPKLIFGWQEFGDRFPTMVDFDWHPAKEPYDIKV